MKSILYVSQSLIPDATAQEEVGSMVDSAQIRNRSLQVTGALLYTGARFAQLLEGPRCSVDEVMASIEKDSRHEQITRLPVRQQFARRFPTWAMAYAGPSLYVDRQIKRYFQDLRGEDPADECDKLIELMWALNQSNPATSIV